MIALFLFLSAVLVAAVVWHRHRGQQKKNAGPTTTPLPSFDYTQVPPARHRPFKPIYHITMALQSSSPDDLIVMDRNYKERVTLRRRVMAENPSTVLGTDGTAAAKDAVDELYAHLIDYLPARYPSVFSRRDENKTLFNAATSRSIPCTPPAGPVEALRLLGETVEDDLFLLREEETGSATLAGGAKPRSAYPATSHRLVAFVCCFPSGFDPSAKLGRLLRDIHEPVPAYDKIGPSIERFMARLAVGQPSRRLNVGRSPPLFFWADCSMH